MAGGAGLDQFWPTNEYPKLKKKVLKRGAAKGMLGLYLIGFPIKPLKVKLFSARLHGSRKQPRFCDINHKVAQ